MAGNENSGRRQEKPFRDALRMQIAAAGNDQKALRAVADVLIAKAMEGDMAAIKELADRIDGKVPQGVHGEEDLPPMKVEHIIKRVIVDAARNDNPDR